MEENSRIEGQEEAIKGTRHENIQPTAFVRFIRYNEQAKEQQKLFRKN